MDNNQVLARFNHERQSLALMEHTNIARILDAGASSRGRPFFVMDYIEGVSSTAYCDLHELTIARHAESRSGDILAEECLSRRKPCWR